MLSKELLQKVKQVQIKSKHLASELFSGEYKSAFRGTGMEFEEVREYLPGDEIRRIDWNVTARLGVPFVKVFREERELSVVFAVDVSASTYFGTHQRQKKEVAAELAALLAYAATHKNDKVGLVLFTDHIERYIPPKKGTAHVWQVIREILSFQPSYSKTNLSQALQFLVKVLPRKSVCFLLSDFLTPIPQNDLKIAALKHDLIGLVLQDAAERKLPTLGRVQWKDLETGETHWVNLNSRKAKRQFAKFQQTKTQALLNQFESFGIDPCLIELDKDYVGALLKLFRKREKRQ